MSTTGLVEARASATPRWKDIPRYPVITGVAILAIGVTVAWWAGVSISALFESAEIRRGQLWRLMTSVFPHLDILHLAFNLYWLWLLGTRVEAVYGHLKTLALILALAIGSNSFEFAFAAPGVGLSGVGYGLFGLLLVVADRDPRFAGALDKRTVNLFAAWFFVCIFLTVTHVFNVGNVAHGAGAVLGALLGYAIVYPGRRLLISGVASGLIVLGVCGSTFLRPSVNFSSQGGYEEEKWGYDELMANRNQEALRWLRDAVKYQPKIALFWANLGIAYHRLNRMSEAVNAYERAYELEPINPDYARAAGKPVIQAGGVPSKNSQ